MIDKITILGRRTSKESTISPELKARILKDAAEMRKEIDASIKRNKEAEEYCMSGEVKVWSPKPKY